LIATVELSPERPSAASANKDPWCGVEIVVSEATRSA
jgi:hypothetical protein